MADPFPSLEKELDLAPFLCWEKDMCPVNFVCLSLAQDSNIGFLLLLFLALSRYFVGGCEGIWLYLGDAFLFYPLLFM